MLKPVQMEKVAVVGLRDERQRVVSLMYDLGVVQVEPLSKSTASILRTGAEAGAGRALSEELLRIRSLVSALPPVPAESKRGFASQQELMETARALDIDQEVSQLKKDQERLNSQIDTLRNRIELVKGLDFMNADLSVFDLENASSFFGMVPANVYPVLSESLAQLDNDVMLYPYGKDPVRLVAVVPRAKLEAFGSILQKSEVRLQRIPPFRGTPPQVLSNLEKELSEAQSQLQRVEGRLQELSVRYLGSLSSIEEQLSIEVAKLEVTNNFGFTESAFAVEGWVPKKSLPELTETMQRHSPSTRVFGIPNDGEVLPPTLMENPRRLRFFESFIRFYSLPESIEFDPTLLFAFTFPIFFGLMLGDVGYSLVILGVSIWILRRLRNRGGRTIIPAGLRNFAKNIFKPSQYGKLARAMIPGALIGLIFGFVFNEYFGFHFNQYLYSALNSSLHLNLPGYLTSTGAILDPISSRGLKTLMLVSGYIGLFEVTLGLVMGMFAKYWARERRHIFGKIGWLAVGWGIALLGLTLLHHGTIDPTVNILAGVYIVMIVGGVGLIIYGEGTLAIIEIPSIISHILSYMRLLGILLASVALALVINSQFEGLAGGLAGGSVTGVAIGFGVAGVVVLVMGQLFNIILSLFEPGIQGARLIYVEFFSKFYHGGGRPFTPFRGKRTHTVSEIEIMEKAQEGKSGGEALEVPAPVPMPVSQATDVREK